MNTIRIKGNVCLCSFCGNPAYMFASKLSNGGTHIGARCQPCRRFLKWLNKDEKALLKELPKCPD